MDESDKTWRIYGCDIVERRPGGAGAREALGAVRVLGDHDAEEVEGLPRGFATYPLLDYDFSDDAQVLKFVNAYGLVMCPYGGAIDRTFAAIEDPDAYRRLLFACVREREGGELRGGAIIGRLASALGLGRPRGGDLSLDPSADFRGCDVEADARGVLHDGVNATPETLYVVERKLGFFGALEGSLLDTERLRAEATNEVARERSGRGEWGRPDCLVSLEEVRRVLYLLQLASVVLRGYAYIDGSHDERRSTGQSTRRYRDELVPGGLDSEEERSLVTRAAVRAAGIEAGERRVERLFMLFIAGRPNLLRALECVCPQAIYERDSPERRSRLPKYVLGADESAEVEARLAEAREASSDDPETLALLDRRPLWQAWEYIERDLAVFLQACLTNCWGTEGHPLVSTEELMAPGIEDGGKVFRQGTTRMTLQRAIAGQIVSDLKEPGNSWQRCEACGEPYVFRCTSTKPVKAGAERKDARRRLPSATTCSDAHRMRVARKPR